METLWLLHVVNHTGTKVLTLQNTQRGGSTRKSTRCPRETRLSVFATGQGGRVGGAEWLMGKRAGRWRCGSICLLVTVTNSERGGGESEGGKGGEIRQAWWIIEGKKGKKVGLILDTSGCVAMGEGPRQKEWWGWYSCIIDVLVQGGRGEVAEVVSYGLVIQWQAMGGVTQTLLSHQSHETQEGFWGVAKSGNSNKVWKKGGKQRERGIAAVAWALFPTESTEIFQRSLSFFLFPDTVLLFCTDARLALPWQRLGEGALMLRHWSHPSFFPLSHSFSPSWDHGVEVSSPNLYTNGDSS